MTNEERIQMVIKEAEKSAVLRRTTGEILAEPLVKLANLLTACIGSGGKLLICGNGGSAADSSHMAAEMIVRLTAEHNRISLPAIALSADTSILTAAGNDFGFEKIFARQVEGLGREGDMLLVISTSGNSVNLIRAVETAVQSRMRTVALLGGNGGRLASMVDMKLIVPHTSVQRIQEEQIFLIHLLVELIEGDLFQ
ncbi:MAG: phosphoheptose isomerase [candidate division Zixibacteria bacterium HGW-Zixibacteria-1]|nr:MAG: phosphoheptose isomerase [candidate division Zixibacteria bacterium HGW-Zixibacteria-1]